MTEELNQIQEVEKDFDYVTFDELEQDVETVEEPTQPEEQKVLDTILDLSKEPVQYNKKDKFLTKDEAKTYIQKGMNYDKVFEKAKKADELEKQLNAFRTQLAELGDTDDEKLLHIEASQRDMDVDELRIEKQKEQERLNSMLENDPIYQLGKQASFEAQKQRDLAEIKSAFPFVTANTIEEIPNFNEFARLMAATNGQFSAKDAFKYVNHVQTKPNTEDKSHMTTIKGETTPQKTVIPANILQDYLNLGYTKEDALKDYKLMTKKKG